MACSKQEESDATNRISLAIEFENARLKTLQELEKLLEKIRYHNRNTSIGVVSGSAAAIAGTVVGGVGFGLAFVTFGTSLILCAVGGAISGAGSLVAVGSKATEFFLNKNFYKEVQAAVEKDRKAAVKLFASFGFGESESSQVVQTGSVSDLHLQGDHFKNGRKALGGLKSLIYDPIKTAEKLKGAKNVASMGKCITNGVDAAVDASATAFKCLSTVGKVLHIGGFAVSVIFLPVDIHVLVTESIKIHKGKVGKIEENIECLIKQLKIPEDFLALLLCELDILQIDFQR